MASQQIVPTASAASTSRPPSIALSQTSSPPVLPVNTETVIMPSGASMTLSVPVASRVSIAMSSGEGCCSDSIKMENEPQDTSSITSVASFLNR